jgi:ribosomal-protein-alanine N-acetyltransferase
MADLDDLFALYSQPELMRYITGQSRSYQETKERLKAHIADRERYGFGLCAAILKATGQMMGRCGLEPVEGKMGIEGTIAWMLKEEYWGQGLATEFGLAMVSYGLEKLGLMRISATADHRNLASIAVMRKIGMRFVRSTERGVEYEICRREHAKRPGALPNLNGRSMAASSIADQAGRETEVGTTTPSI